MLKPVVARKVYQQVVDQIQNMIIDGSVRGGERLPPERRMAERLQVSRNSVREAMRALEILGIVECRHGGGNYIRKNVDSLFEPLSILFRVNNGSFTDLLEFRRMLEAEAAALAAIRASDEQIKQLQLSAVGLSGQIDESELVSLDKRFHFMIAEYSGNFLFVALYNAISRIFESCIKDARQAILDKTHNRERLASQHLNICKAIAGRDPRSAAEAVNEHFTFIIENIEP